MLSFVYLSSCIASTLSQFRRVSSGTPEQNCVPMANHLRRRHAIPVLHVRGTHYDVGFDMGRTFGAIIKSFLQLSSPLNEVYLPLYNTEKGKQVYNDTLESVKKSFPQYVRELEGVADGAQVEFHKLFLLHMDEIMPQSLKHQNVATISTQKQPVGCSTIMLNHKNNRILAHTEDALREALNHYYYVVAHIINETPQGKYNVKEERFMSLCYAGHLPGYTMSYNHHGLVFSINTLSAEVLKSGKTPRHFITRALLSASNYDQAVSILKDTGVGAADGCSINLCFINSPTFYNIEMAPAPDARKESMLNIKEIPEGEYNYHTNKYERIEIEEQDNPALLDSSKARMKTFNEYEGPTCKKDILQMLGDHSGGEHCVFREDGSIEQMVKTLAVGVFDLTARNYTVYADNPRYHEQLFAMPLQLLQTSNTE